MEILELVLGVIPQILHLSSVQGIFANLPWVVTVCTVITALTKTRWPENPLMDGIFRVLNVLAGNILLNKNADDGMAGGKGNQ